MNSPWIHHEFTMNSPWIHHEFTINSPWIHHKFTVNSPWIQHESETSLTISAVALLSSQIWKGPLPLMIKLVWHYLLSVWQSTLKWPYIADSIINSKCIATLHLYVICISKDDILSLYMIYDFEITFTMNEWMEWMNEWMNEWNSPWKWNENETDKKNLKNYNVFTGTPRCFKRLLYILTAV